MSHEIICEGFDLTDGIREAVNKHLSHLKKFLPQQANIHIFMSEPAKHSFKVMMKAHILKKDIIVSKEGGDLYKLLGDARKIFVNNVIEHSNRTKSR